MNLHFEKANKKQPILNKLKIGILSRIPASFKTRIKDILGLASSNSELSEYYQYGGDRWMIRAFARNCDI